MNAPFLLPAVNDERLEIIDSNERLAAVAEQWTRLWRHTDGLIFQSHDWVSAWWHFSKDRDRSILRVGLVWRGETLVAVVPMTVRKRKALRILEWAAVTYSDYGDILCAPECTQPALQALWSRIWDAGGFDLALVSKLLPGSKMRSVIDPDASYQALHKAEVSSRIGGDWTSGAAWLASHPKKVRQNYKRGVRMLEETGKVAFRLVDQQEPIEPVLERLAALKRKWLESNARESDLFDEGGRTLGALVDVLARAGILRLFVLEVNGIMVAISVNFVQRNTMMAWVTSYDTDFARASPGTVLIFDYTQWSFDHGLHLVDLLCGGEAFKDRFASHSVTLEAMMRPRTVKGSLALLADQVRRRLRRSNQRKGVALENGD